MNLKQAKELIKTIYKLQLNTQRRYSIELVSGPGIGKSEAIRQVAKELTAELGKDVGVKPFFLSTVEQPDVRGFGLPAKDSDGAPIMSYTRAPWVPRANDPQHGFLFLDEFQQAPHDVQKPAAELLLNGCVGDSQLPITYMVLAASNRESDRSGVQRSLAFIENRRMRITIEPSLDTWVDWAEREGVHWIAVAFAKRSPGEVFADHVPDKSGPFCTPRSLVKLSYLIDALPLELFTEAAGGLIGEGTAAKFTAFMRVASELPDFEDIVRNPLKCHLPNDDRPDAQYAVMQMVGFRADAKTFKPAFTYIQRMPKEFQVACLRSILRRDPRLANNPEFSEWTAKNSQLVNSAFSA